LKKHDDFMAHLASLNGSVTLFSLQF